MMRKLLFALAVMVLGSFAFAGASPASAMTAGAVTGINEIVKDNPTAEQVRWVRRCWWRHGHRHCRTYWRRGWYSPYFHRHRHHHRHCWWRYGRRYCRY